MKQFCIRKDDQLFLAAMDSFLLQFDESLTSNDKYCRYVRNLLTTHPDYQWIERNPLSLKDPTGLQASNQDVSYLHPDDQDIYDCVIHTAKALSPQYIPLPSKVINQLKLREFGVGDRRMLSLGDLQLKMLCTDGYFHRLRLRSGKFLSFVNNTCPHEIIKLRMYIFSSVINDLALRYDNLSYPPTSLIDHNYIESVVYRYIDGKHIHTDEYEYFSDMYLQKG